ncbi:MAG: hypothetical protein ER33_06850 [Cyanobium sp. CACIAM 14]|nr:MAG: hypothetical protein ER33_06850 [Cyanobium sp. CACIAM 14]
MPSAPFTPSATAQVRTLSLLLAPSGQLSGDGQLRELIEERRDRKGPDVEIWYLPPALVEEMALGSALEEAVLAGDPAVITWLQLRFGGRRSEAPLSPTLLHDRARGLPPRAPLAPVHP